MLVRKWFLKRKPPAFLKPKAKGSKLLLSVLTAGLATKAAALTEEAFQAARLIAKAPRTVRGGPWSKPGPLGEQALGEIRRVACCRSLRAITTLSDESPGSRLWKHLRGVKFATTSKVGSEALRGGFVYKAKKSGTPGNKSRRRRVARKKLTKGTLAHVQSHRGSCPVVRRKRETERRPSR